MDVGRKRTVSEGLPDNLYVDGDSYRYVNPETGVRTRLGADRAKAIELAHKANLVLEARRLARQTAPQPTIAHGVDMYLENVVPHKPWDTGTAKNNRYRLAVIKRELGDRMIATTDRVFLGEWLNAKAKAGDLYNKWRALLVDLWRYWISKRWQDFNEAEAVMKRSTSAKLEVNRRQRGRLELADYWAIHDHDSCPLFLQIAMEQSLITLQARAELCAMELAHYRDGWLYVIRDKVAGDSEMAFIRIALTPELEAIKRRAVSDGVPSPLLIHRRPERQKPAQRARKRHWTAVDPSYLTKAFATVRDATGRWNGVPARQRPTFHEIRSLGARTYRAAGYPEAYIQALMTHADKKTTAIYLEGGKLTDEHFHRVEAGLKLEQLK